MGSGNTKPALGTMLVTEAGPDIKPDTETGSDTGSDKAELFDTDANSAVNSNTEPAGSGNTKPAFATMLVSDIKPDSDYSSDQGEFDTDANSAVGFNAQEAVGEIYKKTLQMPFKQVFTWESIKQLLSKSPQNVHTFEKDLLDARPIVHTRVLSLLRDFIRVKQSHGNQLERKVFADATPTTLIQRFLRCRPVVFMTEGDTFLLRNSHRYENLVGIEMKFYSSRSCIRIYTAMNEHAPHCKFAVA